MAVLAKGMNEIPYQINAMHCTMTQIITAAGFPETKAAISVAMIDTIRKIVVKILVLSNMALSCFIGPQRKIVDRSEQMVPRV